MAHSDDPKHGVKQIETTGYIETTTTKKHSDRLLVNGFIRINIGNHYHAAVPSDVLNLCFLWFHIESYLLCGGADLEINEDRNEVTHKCQYYNYNSCYGSLVMPSCDGPQIEYSFKLKVIKNAHEIAIGIDDSKCKHIDADFSGQRSTKNYAYYSADGTEYNWTTGNYANRGITYGNPYSTGDVIEMKYNPHEATLQFFQNGIDQGIIRNIVKDEDLSYRLCIYMGHTKGTVVHLLE